MTIPQDACTKCKLYHDCHSPFMPPDVFELDGGQCDVMFVGEAPGCISGDSMIEVAYSDKSLHPHGMPIKYLVGISGFYVYSYDTKTGSVVLGLVKRVWKTGRKKVYKVTYEWKYATKGAIIYLQDSISVSSNHPFLLRQYASHDTFNGTQPAGTKFASISDGLDVGYSIQPFFRHTYNGYSHIGTTGQMLLEPRWLLEQKIGRSLTQHENCHHDNRNTLDDTWDNLILKSICDHSRTHFIEDGNPMSNPNFRQHHKEVMESEEYRNSMSVIMKRVLSNPEQHTRRLQQIASTNESRRSTVKKLYDDPVYYYKFLLGRQNQFHLSGDWLYSKFHAKFPDYPTLPENHKIVSIEYVGVEDVYDMEVDVYHNFAVNGIFVHNSEEDVQNMPFVGKTGQLLRDVIQASGLLHYHVMYTNAVRCRPPENATPTARQITYCQPLLKAEIEQYQPRLIVPLGNVPLKSVLGETGISNWHGALLERDGHTFIPTYHPSYISRNNAELMAWLGDFDKIFNFISGADKQAVSGDVSEQYELFWVDDKTTSAISMYDFIKTAGECSFDTESDKGVKPFVAGTHPIMVSFAAKNKRGQHRAWACDIHDKSVLSWVKKLLTDESIGKVMHNGKYDIQVCLAEWGFEIVNITGDALVLSYVIDSVPGRHGLKELAGRKLGMYAYNQPLADYHAQHPESNPAKGGDNSLVPVELMAEYAALDAVATLELHDVLLTELEPHQLPVYQELMLQSVTTLARTEAHGLVVDEYMVDRYAKVYQTACAAHLEQLATMPVVQKYVSVRGKPRLGKKGQPLKNQFAFNPNSPIQMREILFDKKYLGLTATEKTETGMASTRWDSIKQYAASQPLLQEMHIWDMLDHMLSTYIKPVYTWRGRDGKVHQTFVQDGTVSGRLASKEPNSQNIPTPEKEPGTLLAVLPIKNLFTYEHKRKSLVAKLDYDELLQAQYDGEEGCILVADQSGMELRTMASLSDCHGMKEAFASGIDVHSVVTSKLYNIPLDEVLSKRKTDEAMISLRYHAKWVNWTLLFGGSWWTLMRLYGIPEDEAKRLVATYYAMFPEVRAFNQDCLNYARKHGYLDSKFGRRRYFPYINDKDEAKRHRSEREAMNHPVQSPAADVVLCAMIVIDDLLHSAGALSRPMNTVHDSVMLDIYPGELHETAAVVRDVMEHITDKYGPIYFPGLDFTWFSVPLKADLEYGHHYGCLEEYRTPKS